jgi:ACS family hexuronate transporter-like MFS transporter
MIRWRIALLVSTAIAISYLDRQALPVAVKAIEKDIPMTQTQFATVTNAFLYAYALMYLVGGKIIDVLGTRRGFTLIMVFWSLACMSQGLATSITMLAISRFLLGMGEGGGFPAATRAVTEWFPVKERALAMGIINGGTSVGMVLAPPLIALILSVASWPWVFFISGAFGIIWLVWWQMAYFPPDEHPQISPAEREQIHATGSTETLKQPSLPWLTLLGYRETWGLVIAKFLSDAAWYFYLFWLPRYLFDERGFDIKAVGTFAWIPPAAAGIGCLVGGWLSSWLLHRNVSVNYARKIALGASAIVMPLIWLVPNVPVSWAIALFSVAYFGQQSWSTLVMTLPTDIFPRSTVGAVAGMVGCGGALGGIVLGSLAGRLLDAGYGWGVVFAIAGSLHILAFLVICVVIPRIQPLRVEPIAAG